MRHGHTTFAISYRNPDEALRHFSMDDYLRLGLLAAMDAVARITENDRSIWPRCAWAARSR